MTDLYADLIAEDGGEFSSSNIDIVGYDRENKTLYIEFQSGPAVYAYKGVEESTYNLLVTAPSVGRFYTTHVQGEYTAEKFQHGVIVQREEEDEDLSPQGDRKWLSVPEGETPEFAQGGLVAGPGEIRLSGESIFAGSMLTIPVIQPTRYAIEYTVEHDGTSGRYKPEFIGLSEADVLAQFNAGLSQLETLLGWTDVKVKIVSVTHYFD